ncbi:MAG: ABC transporter substrate-binding protein [Nanoarchaeota archaeon]|nr:ABC transporter substrate-binding protein [Nanoarchaeota archaeon]
MKSNLKKDIWDNRNLRQSILPIALIVCILAFSIIVRLYDTDENIQGQVIKTYLLDAQGNPMDVPDGTIDIGILTTRSGRYGFIGEEVLKGLELARQEVESMTNNDIKFCVKDSHCNPELAETHLQSFENMDFIIVADCYKNGMYAFREDNLIFLRPYESEDDTNTYFDPEVGAEVRHFFDSLEVEPKEMMIVFPDDYYGTSYKESLKQEFSNRFGKRVTSSYAYEVGQEWFGTISLKIASINPDSLFLVAEKEEDLLQMVPQIREQGYMNQIYINLPISEFKDVDPISFDDTIIITDFNPISKRTIVQEFSEAMRNVFDQEPSLHSARAYDSLLTLGSMISESGKPGYDGLYNFEGVTGVMTMTNNHLKKTFYMLRIRNNQIVDFAE